MVQKQPTAPKQEETPKNSEIISTNFSFARSQNNEIVLLQTARAKIHATENDFYSHQTRILFDSCSQKSYVTSSLREKLSLKAVGSETVIMKNKSINVALQNHPHLQSLEMADVFSSPQKDGENLEVHLMIGADYYWSFIQNTVVRGELMVVLSHFQHVWAMF